MAESLYTRFPNVDVLQNLTRPFLWTCYSHYEGESFKVSWRTITEKYSVKESVSKFSIDFLGAKKNNKPFKNLNQFYEIFYYVKETVRRNKTCVVNEKKKIVQ